MRSDARIHRRWSLSLFAAFLQIWVGDFANPAAILANQKPTRSPSPQANETNAKLKSPAAPPAVASSALGEHEAAPYLVGSGDHPLVPVMFYSAALSPDEQWLAGGTSDWTKPGELLIWNAATQQAKYRHQFGLGVRAVTFSPDSKLLAAGTFTNEIFIYDLSRNSVVAYWKPHTGAVNGLAFSRDGELLASASLDKSVKVWQVEMPASPAAGLPLRAKLEGHRDWVFSVVFSADSKTLFSGGRERKLFAWDVVQNKPLSVWNSLPAGVEFLAMAPAGDAVALGLWNGTIELRNPKDGTVSKTLTHLPDNQYTVSTVAFSQDGKWLASSASDGTAKLWKYPSGELQTTIQAHQGHAWAAAPTRNAERMMTAGTDGNLRMYEVANQQQLFQLPFADTTRETTAAIVNVAWSSNRRSFATSHADFSVRIREGRTGRSERVLTAPVELHSLTFSDDEQYLGGIGSDGTIYLWDLSQETPAMITLRRPKRKESCLAFGPDHGTLYSGSADGTIQQWDIPSAMPGRILASGMDEISCLTVSRDRNWLAAAGSSPIIKVWEIGSQQPASAENRPVAILRSDLAPIRHLKFATQQPYLVSASLNNSFLLWNLTDLKSGGDPATNSKLQPRKVLAHTQPITSLAFSPQGNWLATSSDDKLIRLWDVRTGAPGQLLPSTSGSRGLAFDSMGLRSVGANQVMSVWEAPVPISFPTTKGRYVKLKALSAIQTGDPFASAAEIILFADGRPLSKSRWKLVSVDSQNKGNEATRAFDDDPTTFWHTQWQTDKPLVQPHELVIDLGQVRQLTGLFVLSRSDDSRNGTIRDYELFISEDPQKFGRATSAGQLNPPVSP